eukprot:5184377-Heterocapsa_arctica.AAC.1
MASRMAPVRCRLLHGPHEDEPERHLRHLLHQQLMSYIIINTYYPNKKFTSNYFIMIISDKMNSTITIEDSDI